MEKLGAEVTWFDDRPSNSFISKVFIRLNKNSLKQAIDSYYATILQSVKDKKFDYVLFISPESVNKKSLKAFKLNFTGSKFILYMWDSFKNKQSFDLVEYFDSVLTFDSEDASEYKLSLRPLFYIDTYKQAEVEPTNDLLFIGTAHSDRYNFIKKFIEPFFEGKKIKLYFFLSSKKLYWLKKAFDSNFRRIKYSDVSFESLSHQDNANFMNASKMILDINHPGQVGLTMRTIECIGAQKKLITTNSNIRDYDFFDPANILVIDRKDPQIDRSFLDTPFKPLPPNLLFKYSINGWLADVLK
ncbi:CgeB family protein [Mucilaginibacter glaciei]|uniref:Lipopolysaccharide biosynthesis protein n=1 Tax=Mucilaginibacter glaciei TaxID=2772109 RepID=A0A926NPJ5_9SPHI|nr:hypothetical protein [Mucilaginibacter glaciei]MBD1392317.1 hypothetical protein [Mucilaginibacter glaciei]